MKLLFVDIETTSLDVKEAHIVEIACYGAELKDYNFRIVERWARLIKPPISIPPEASAIHHLVDEDVAGARPLEEYDDEILGRMVEADFIVGHNIIKYDIPILENHLKYDFSASKFIDTWRLARHTWPDLPGYSQEALRYRFKLHPAKKELTWPWPDRSSPHCAAFDVSVNINLFRNLHSINHAQARVTITDLTARSNMPFKIETMYFGKHSGTKVSELPRDYVAWLMRQSWLPEEHPDLHWTLKQ